MTWEAFAMWSGNFVCSPGFGGVAAVFAASLAYRSAAQTANHHRNIAARDRWWDQAKWAFDRLDTPITQASALEAFNELLDQAYDDAERAFVEAALRPGLSGTLTDNALYEAQ